MVTLTIKLEVPDERAAHSFSDATRGWCEDQEGWALLSITEGDSDVPRCCECGAQMVYEPRLQEYVCGHPED